jgi:hypothetical protein
MRLKTTARWARLRKSPESFGTIETATRGRKQKWKLKEAEGLGRKWVGAAQGAVLILDRNGNERARIIQAGPGFVTDGPNALGLFGEASGLQASYRVDVEGFQPWTCPEDDAEASRTQGQGCCLMHFTSHGYVAREHTPNQAELEESARQYAEHQLKAGVVLGKFSLSRCQL